MDDGQAFTVFTVFTAENDCCLTLRLILQVELDVSSHSKECETVHMSNVPMYWLISLKLKCALSEFTNPFLFF